jgi:hypothetical protein
MKEKMQVCRQCKHEEKIKLYDREDAERLRLRLERPQCKKCGSFNVELYD